jgi:hypothetical protein
LILNFDEPRSFYSEGVYPYKTNGVGARSAQDFAKNLHGRNTVRADRRLRADNEAIRAQSTIFG